MNRLTTGLCIILTLAAVVFAGMPDGAAFGSDGWSSIGQGVFIRSFKHEQLQCVAVKTFSSHLVSVSCVHARN